MDTAFFRSSSESCLSGLYSPWNDRYKEEWCVALLRLIKDADYDHILLVGDAYTHLHEATDIALNVSSVGVSHQVFVYFEF